MGLSGRFGSLLITNAQKNIEHVFLNITNKKGQIRTLGFMDISGGTVTGDRLIRVKIEVDGQIFADDISQRLFSTNSNGHGVGLPINLSPQGGTSGNPSFESQRLVKIPFNSSFKVTVINAGTTTSGLDIRCKSDYVIDEGAV